MQPITFREPDTGLEKTYLVPTEFHELTQDQYLGAVAVINNLHDRPELQWALIPLIMKIPLQEFEVLNEVQRVQVLQELSFLFDPEKLPHQAMIKSFSTLQYRNIHCPRKIARALSTTLYGPGDALGNLTFGEFMAAEQRLELFNKNPVNNGNALNDFCGILYRKTSKEQKQYLDKRVRFHEGLIPKHGDIFQVVTKDVKSAIVMNYQGGKSMFPKLYRKLFPPSLQEDPTEQPTAKKPKTSQSLMWLDMLVAMADRDVTKLEDVKSAKLHAVLKVLDDTIAHNKKMQEEVQRRAKR